MVGKNYTVEERKRGIWQRQSELSPFLDFVLRERSVIRIKTRNRDGKRKKRASKLERKSQM